MTTLTNRTELFNFLDNDWTSPFEKSHTEKDGTDVFFVFLNQNDNRTLPTTPTGFMKRLGMLDEFGFLLNDNRLDFLVDDGSLLVRLK